MADYATIRVERADALTTVTLNRPEQRNGMTNRMLRETCEALTAIARDGATRVLVLTGAGNSFCPGADINLATTRSEHRRRQREESKRDMRPRVLNVQHVNSKTNESRTLFKSDEKLAGPGLLVWVATPLGKPTAHENETRLERIARELPAKSKGPTAADPRPDDKS